MTDPLTPRRIAEIRELLADAEGHHRLSSWEEEFLESIREKLDTYGERAMLTDKQECVLNRIEQKVYANG